MFAFLTVPLLYGQTLSSEIYEGVSSTNDISFTQNTFESNNRSNSSTSLALAPSTGGSEFGQAGVMFDISNLSTSEVTIESFDFYVRPGTWDMQVYVSVGNTYNGIEFSGTPGASNADWIYIGQTTINSSDDTVTTNVPLGFNLPASSCKGVFVTSTVSIGGGPIRYTNSEGNTFTDGVLTTSHGVARTATTGVFGGTQFGTSAGPCTPSANFRTPRGFLNYDIAPPPNSIFEFCATDTPLDFAPPVTTSSANAVTSTANPGDLGVIGTGLGEYTLANVTINSITDSAEDRSYQLQSPNGTILMLDDANGGTTGLDVAADLVFTDDSANDITTWTGGAPLADYMPEGGDFATVFAGEPIDGDWFLIVDSNPGNQAGGTVNSYCITFVMSVGTPPEIFCPADFVADNDEGFCGAIVNFTPAFAIDFEDGVLDPSNVVQTGGPASGTEFPVGDTDVTFTATDSHGNQTSCTFVVTINDAEAPMAVCQDFTVILDAAGNGSMLASDIDGGSTDNCAVDSLVASQTDFTCADVGENTIVLEVSDAAGNVSTCDAIVTVVDETAPVIECIGQPVYTNILVNGSFEDGTLNGWTAIDNPAPFIPFGVYPSIGFPVIGVPDAFPTDGAFLAGNGFDGGAGEAVIYQEISIPADANVELSWDENIDYNLLDFCNGCEDRIYEVQIRDLSDNVLEVLKEVTAFGGVLEDDNVWESVTADLSAYAGQTVRIAFWESMPESNTGPAKFALDNVQLNVITAALPYEVDLNADGTVSVLASDLIDSVDEACGYSVTVAGEAAGSSLSTTFANDNGGALGGAVYFDVTVGATELSLESIDVHTPETAAFTMEVFAIVGGTYVGNEGDASAWTSIGTSSGTGLGAGTPSPTTLGAAVTLTANTTYAMALVMDANASHAYTNGDGSNEAFSNADLSIALGAASNVAFDGSPFAPRVWNGTLNYTGGAPSGSPELLLDCSNLGENMVEVIVTDDSGNVSTCMATVVVNDVTAPVLVCEDTTIELGEDGTYTIDPLDLIGTMPSTYNVITIGSDNQSGTAGTTDLTVDVTEAASLSFDWDYVSEDVPGFDSFGYLVNGTYTALTDGSVTSGSAMVDVLPGDVFGFRSESTDGLFGSSTTTITNFMPGFAGQFAPENWTETLDNSDGSATFVEIPGGTLAFDACGIDVLIADLEMVTCDDIGTPITVTVFATDASGNVSSCTSVVTVVDAMAPVLTCPEDESVMVDPDGTHTVADYIESGAAFATDNCADPVTITQDPVAGTILGVGVWTITFTAEDDYGNISTCEMELDLTLLGTEDNELNNAIALYPNPANEQVTISNSSNIALETAMIYDLNGKLVSQINLQNMQSEKVIDVSAYATGVYMVYITGEQSSVVKRLIKK